MRQQAGQDADGTDRGHLHRSRRPEVPGPDLAPAQRRGRRGPRVPQGRDRPARHRRRLVRGLRSRPERVRQDPEAGDDLRDHRHRGQPVQPGLDRHEVQRLRLQPGPDPGQGPAAESQRHRGAELDQRPAAALQDPARLARQPPARAQDPQPRQSARSGSEPRPVRSGEVPTVAWRGSVGEGGETGRCRSVSNEMPEGWELRSTSDWACASLAERNQRGAPAQASRAAHRSRP